MSSSAQQVETERGLILITQLVLTSFNRLRTADGLIIGIAYNFFAVRFVYLKLPILRENDQIRI